MAETYYDRLGVAADATREEIERAYRERLKETHPDVSDDPDAGERTRALIEARDVLTDETERARYDRLGHDRYVEYHDSFVEATADDVDAADPEPAGSDPSGSGSADPGPTAQSAGSRTGRASDAGGTASASGSAGSSGATRSTAADWNTGYRAGKTSASADRDRRRAQNEQTRAAWNAGGQRGQATSSGESYAREWHAWDTGSAHRVHPTDTSTIGNRLFPPGPSLILLAMAFAVYPVMLWAAVTPGFPLTINLVVWLCILGVVAFLQSLPGVGIVVFGTWSLVLPATLALGFGVPLASPLWALSVGGTVLPFGLSVLTWIVLRH